MCQHIWSLDEDDAGVNDFLVWVCRETVGMRLLQRLGWRPGQGVGPRVSRRQKLSDKREKRRMLASQGAAAKGNGRLLQGFC